MRITVQEITIGIKTYHATGAISNILLRQALEEIRLKTEEGA